MVMKCSWAPTTFQHCYIITYISPSLFLCCHRRCSYITLIRDPELTARLFGPGSRPRPTTDNRYTHAGTFTVILLPTSAGQHLHSASISKKSTMWTVLKCLLLPIQILSNQHWLLAYMHHVVLPYHRQHHHHHHLLKTMRMESMTVNVHLSLALIRPCSSLLRIT